MRKLWNTFWSFYERNYTLTLGLTVFLFVLQILHLFWLFSSVIWFKAFGYSLYIPGPVLEKLLILIDYTEIPALIGASLVYIEDLRQKFSIKSILFLIFLNTQWLHLFWITDEFVVSQFTNFSLPSWLAWTAILIDYLELPVIFDTLNKFSKHLMEGQLKNALNVIKEKS